MNEESDVRGKERKKEFGNGNRVHSMKKNEGKQRKNVDACQVCGSKVIK